MTTRIEIARKVEDLLGSFQLTRNTVIGEGDGYFDVQTATVGNGGTVWLYPNGEFCGVAVFFSVADLEELAANLFPSEREKLIQKLCGENYNRI